MALSPATRAKVDAFLTLPSPEERRRRREACGLSAADLAVELGVSQPTLSRWERGDQLPRGKHLVAYVNVLAELERRAS